MSVLRRGAVQVHRQERPVESDARHALLGLQLIIARKPADKREEMRGVDSLWTLAVLALEQSPLEV